MGVARTTLWRIYAAATDKTKLVLE